MIQVATRLLGFMPAEFSLSPCSAMQSYWDASTLRLAIPTPGQVSFRHFERSTPQSFPLTPLSIRNPAKKLRSSKDSICEPGLRVYGPSRYPSFPLMRSGLERLDEMAPFAFCGLMWKAIFCLSGRVHKEPVAPSPPLHNPFLSMSTELCTTAKEFDNALIRHMQRGARSSDFANVCATAHNLYQSLNPAEHANGQTECHSNLREWAIKYAKLTQPPSSSVGSQS